MKNVSILEDADKLQADDWCRPLGLITMGGGQSDYYSFRSVYSGQPENNLRWVRFGHVFGAVWHGKTAKHINDAVTAKGSQGYEFLRGEIPEDHKLDLSDYIVLKYNQHCSACGGEGKIYTSRYGGNDPDVWPIGECEACEGSGWEDVNDQS